MMRFVVIFGIFVALATLELSFLHSLPGVLAMIPLVLAVSIYLIQHHGLSIGAWWIAGFGLLLDILHLSQIPLVSIAYFGTAGAVTLLARRVFSNRSLYGILGAGLCALVFLTAIESVLLGILWLRQPELTEWAVYFREQLWALAGMGLVLAILFAFAARIRQLLTTTFLISEARDQY